MPKTLIENVVYALAGPGVRQYRLLPDGSLRVVDRDLRKLAFDADGRTTVTLPALGTAVFAGKPTGAQ